MKYYYIKEKSKQEYPASSINPKYYNSFLYNNSKFESVEEPVQFVARTLRADSFCLLPYCDLAIYAHCMLPALKKVLQNFEMPEHRWMQMEVSYDEIFLENQWKYHKITYDINKDEKFNYWFLQLLDRKMQELDFRCTTFKTSEGKDLGAFRNFEEYHEVKHRLIREYREEYDLYGGIIKADTYYYNKNYDILWAGNQIVFNEKVKEAIEETQLIIEDNELVFQEFTEYKIEMLGE